MLKISKKCMLSVDGLYKCLLYDIIRYAMEGDWEGFENLEIIIFR